MNKYKGKGKFSITFFIVLAMVVQIVAPSILNITFAEEENEGTETIVDGIQEEGGDEEVQSSGVVEENLITSFELIINPGDDQITVGNGDDLEVNIDDLNALMLNFTLKRPDDVTLSPGDTYTIDLPDIFKDAGAATQDITIDGGVVIGTYVIENNQIVITFTEKIENYDDAEMHVSVSGEFNTEIFEEKQEVEIEVPYQEGEQYKITIRAKQKEYKGEDKKEAGKPYILNEDGSKTVTNKNPTHVDWTVIANDSMKRYNNAKIIDDLGENLKIVEGSFEIYRIIRNYNNEEVRRELVSIEPTITDSGFDLNLGSIEHAYEITYTTELSRPDGGGVHTINNTARIELDVDLCQYFGQKFRFFTNFRHH